MHVIILKTRYLSNYAKTVLFKMYKLKRSFFSIILAVLIYQFWHVSETLLKSFGPSSFDMKAHSYDGIMQSEKYNTITYSSKIFLNSSGHFNVQTKGNQYHSNMEKKISEEKLLTYDNPRIYKGPILESKSQLIAS